MRRLHRFALGLTLLVAACVPPASVAPPASGSGTAPSVTAGRFAALLAALPGAVVAQQGDLLTIRYPDQVLFATGAALPFPGGRELLDPLSDLLLSLPDGAWQGTVRVAPGTSFGQEQLLADKRVELLARYFNRRGLPQGVPGLHGEVADGAPLELRLQPAPLPPEPGSSAAGKR